MTKVAGIPNFKASVSQTKNGNDYKKTKICTTLGTTAGALAAGADIFVTAGNKALTGMSIVKKAQKILPKAAMFLGSGIAAGLIADFVINKSRAKKADKNPMPIEQKFVRDLKSQNYIPRYDAEFDEVVLIHKKDKKMNYSPKHNVYRLQNDGSAALIGGRDFIPPENTYIDNGDGTGAFVTHTEKPFIENNETVKKYINAVKKAMFDRAVYDEKNYSFKYDKEKDAVVLSRMPAMTIDGPVPFESFNIKSDGTMSVVSANGKYEREIEGINGIMIFDDYADENTSVRKFKSALNDALGEKGNYSLSYNKISESLILTKKALSENKKEDDFSPYYIISPNKYGHKGGAMVSYVYSNHNGDPLFSPNAKIILNGSQEMLDLLNSFKEQQESEE